VLIVRALAAYPMGQVDRQPHSPTAPPISKMKAIASTAAKLVSNGPRRTGSLIVSPSLLITEFGTARHLMERTALLSRRRRAAA
jgi:hypothetical protein